MLVVVADPDDNDVTVPHVRRAVLEAGGPANRDP